MTRTASLICFALLATFAAMASPISINSNLNVLVHGSMSASNSSIAGTVATGGSASFSNMSIANGNNAAMGNTPDSGKDALSLLVGGSLQWGNGQLTNGSAVYGGAASLSNLGIPNGTITGGVPPIDFAALAASTRSTSAELASLEANGDTKFQYGGVSFTGEDTKLNIFSIDGSKLGSVHTAAIFVPEGAAVLINIVGVAGSFNNAGLTLNGKSFNHSTNAGAWSEVLWNFSGDGSFQSQGVNFAGSLLAPNAAVTLTNGKFNGQLVAGSLTSTAAINNFSFNGTTGTVKPPIFDDSISTSPVPEPGTLLLAGCGMLLLLIGNFRRTRTKATA